MAIAIVALSILPISRFTYFAIRGMQAQAIVAKIDQLVHHRPADVSESEWAILVYWTHNLHHNSVPQVNLSISQLWRLSNDLDEMLLKGPDRHSIDHLWEQYSIMTDSGARYREKYEPYRDAIIAESSRMGSEYFDRSSYEDFVDSVKIDND